MLLTTRLVVGAAMLGVAVGMSGCFCMRPAAAERTAAVGRAPDDAWPGRDEQVARELLARTPRVIHVVTPPEGATLPAGTRVEYEVGEMKVASGGALRFYRDPSEADGDPVSAGFRAMFGDFRPSGSYVSSTVINGVRHREWVEEQRASNQSSPVRDDRLPQGTVRSTVATEIGLESGVRFQVPEPGSPDIGQRGLIVHYTALTSNEYEKRFLDGLRAQGWTVIDFDTWVGFEAPRSEAAMGRLPELEQRRKACTDEWRQIAEGMGKLPRGRRAEKRERTKELNKQSAALSREIGAIKRGWFNACTPEEAEVAGRAIAAASDDAFAENAYAAEAVLDYLREHRPDLPTEPVVIVGFSAGALAAPAVAARLGERVRGLVLIGGGADVMTIARTTKLPSVSLGLRCDDQPVNDELFEAARDSYRRHSRLDPYVLAPTLAETPVLMVHAHNDVTVPAETGNVLWDRLGRPCRLDFLLDHYALFYFMPEQAPRVAKWLDRHVPKP